jgi:hypothetical protein
MSNENRPLTFTERFQQIEKTVGYLAYQNEMLQRALEGILASAELQSQDMDTLRYTSKALIDLSVEKKAITMDAVVERITVYQSEAIQKRLENDLKEGFLKETETPETEQDIISFKTPDIVFGVNSLSLYKEKAKEFFGKKKGDVVEGIEILGIYRSDVPKGMNNEQAAEG